MKELLGEMTDFRFEPDNVQKKKKTFLDWKSKKKGVTDDLLKACQKDFGAKLRKLPLPKDQKF